MNSTTNTLSPVRPEAALSDILAILADAGLTDDRPDDRPARPVSVIDQARAYLTEHAPKS